MTRRDDIERALDTAIHAAFPSGDVGYPVTPHTERTRAIMESAIVIAGVPVRCYNFHEVGKNVSFNVSYPDTTTTGEPCLTVGAKYIKVRTLDTLSDAAIIQMYVPIFRDYKHEDRPRVLRHDPNDE